MADLALDKAMLEEVARGKLLSPKRRCQAVIKLQSVFQVSERRACAVVGQSRATQRYVPTIRADEDALTKAIRFPGTRVWPLRLPPDHSPAQEPGLGGG